MCLVQKNGGKELQWSKRVSREGLDRLGSPTSRVPRASSAPHHSLLFISIPFSNTRIRFLCVKSSVCVPPVQGLTLQPGVPIFPLKSDSFLVISQPTYSRPPLWDAEVCTVGFCL